MGVNANAVRVKMFVSSGSTMKNNAETAEQAFNAWAKTLAPGCEILEVQTTTTTSSFDRIMLTVLYTSGRRGARR